MKLSPLIIFIILILTLVVATSMKKEGFISFGEDVNPLSSVSVNAYNGSNKITKLYDDIYYDSRNGNVVILEEDNSILSKIYIIPRDQTSQTVTYKKGTGTTELRQDTSESKISSITPTYGSYISKGASANIIYNAWGDDTHIYVLDVEGGGNTSVQGNSSVKPVVSVSYNGNTRHQYNTDYTDVHIPIVSSYTTSSDPNNNKMVTVTGYERKLYQLVPNVLYDVSNGSLLVKNGTTYDAYERGSTTKSSENLASKSFSQFTQPPIYIADTAGNNTILYHPLGEYTQIIVFGNTLNNGQLKVVNSKRFDMNGIYSPTVVTGISPPATTDTSNNTINPNEDVLDAFAKWYMYFYGNDVIDNSENSKYLLKTQVVPPVCPACPGCSGDGVCTDCGGKGGYGTKDTSGSLAFSNDKTLIGATGNVLSNTVGATGNVLSKAVGTTGEVVNKTVDTAGNVVTGVVGKTLDTAGNVVGKTFDTAGNILGSAGHALGLDRVGYSQSYGGPVNTSSSANAQGYGYNRNMTGYSSLPNGNPRDPYSYNGQLQSKGANFIPITANFSSFGK